MMRLKQCIGKVNKHQHGTVRLKDSPEVCRDLEWFTGRFPLVNVSARAMAKGSRTHRRTLEHLERIHLPGEASLSFPLAVPARDYQAQAAEVFLARGSLLLADQLGLGKSITALAAITDARTKPALIVVQSHLPKQWKNYAGRFMPMAEAHIITSSKIYDLPPADIYIITYHKLSAWAEVLSKFVKCVIFDEVQELRHCNSGKYTAARHIRENAPFAMGLSATPIYNYGGEIFNILEILSPGAVGTFEEFKREWCSQAFRHDTLDEPDAFGSYLRDQHLMIRRTRAEVGRELPPVQTIVHTIEHDQTVLDDLNDVATELAHRILAQDTIFTEKGEAAREFDMRMRQATGIAKAPFVAAFVRMLVESGETVLLSGWHRAVYDVWREKLGHPFSMFTGSESPAQKQIELERFLTGKTNIFIISNRAGSGLDGLQERCSTVVHGELDWSGGVHEQIRGRLFRDGQKSGIMEYYLVSDAGSDPVIADIIGLKNDQLRGILEPDGSGLQQQASTEGRVKLLAQEFLKGKGSSHPVLSVPSGVKNAV